MDLYFSPLACSMATRIALYEAGAPATFIEVDAKTKLTLDGKNFREVNPLGLVPVLRTDDGDVVTENAAILQYVADRFPEAQLAPADELGRVRLRQWLCFIGTELHKGLFSAMLDPKAPAAAKEWSLEKSKARLDHLNAHLTDREHLLEGFSVADAYLVTVLGWTLAVPAVDLSRWPAIADYASRLRKRPSVAKAIGEERALYGNQMARHQAAS